MLLITRPKGGSANDERLLDSWKEIASYLGRSVRTVQTWEKHEGLPVHRHQHRKAGTVYAYPSEIDAWRGKRDQFDHREATISNWPRRLWLPIAIATLFALVVASWRVFDDRRALRSAGSVSPAVEAGDWLLIANFDNLTGEEIFDGTLEAALRRQLAGFVKVAPQERLGDTLRLMHRAADTPVDASLARQMARHDPGIRAVLVGRVEGDALSVRLSVDLLSPTEGVTLASMSEVAAGPEAILPAVHRLSLRVRESLGGDLPPSGPDGVERPDDISTPSLQALRLHSLADQQLREFGSRADRAAEVLLREAIAADPGFASAHILLAWTSFRRVQPPADYLAHAARAFELKDRATVVERYFIAGSLHHLRWMSSRRQSDADQALAQYQALLQLDPGHYWARHGCWELLNKVNLGRQALALSLRSLEARPNDVQVLSQVAFQLVIDDGDLEQARAFVDRAKEVQQEVGVNTGHSEALLEFYLPHELWVRGEVGAAIREVDRIVDSLASGTSLQAKNTTILAYEAQGFYLDLGMFDRAEELQRTYSIYPPHLWDRLMAWRRADREWVATLLRDRKASATPSELADAAWDLAYLGLPAEAYAQLEELPDDLPLAAQADVLSARGALDLLAGRYSEAISNLEESLTLRPGNGGERFRTVVLLARAWAAHGEPEQGLRLLEEASRRKPRMLAGRYYWMGARLQQAETYRQLGREPEALAIERQLRADCAWADPEFPILRELQKRG